MTLSWRSRTIAVALPLTLLLTACGSGADEFQPAAQPIEHVASFEMDTTPLNDPTACFLAPDSEQRVALQEFTSTVPEPAEDEYDDTCILTPNAAGGYDQHTYDDDDHLEDFLLYGVLFRNSSILSTYGLVSGDLDVGQYLALQLLHSVNTDGSVHKTYQHTNHGWGRQPMATSKVTNVYYGNGHKATFAEHSKSRPAEYKAKPLTPSTDAVATVTKVGKTTTVKPLKDVKASALLATAKVVKPKPLKAISPALSVNNPNKGTQTTAPTTTTSKAPSSKTSKPPSNKSSNTKSKSTNSKPKSSGKSSKSGGGSSPKRK